MPLGYAATWKRLSTNFARAAASLPTDLLTCPFLIMCIASMPSVVRTAVWNERKHCIRAVGGACFITSLP